MKRGHDGVGHVPAGSTVSAAASRARGTGDRHAGQPPSDSLGFGVSVRPVRGRRLPAR